MFFFSGDTKIFFWWIQNVFREQKIVLDIFGSQGGLINCVIVLDILEGQKRQGWSSAVGDPKSSRKSSRKQQHTQQDQQHNFGGVFEVLGASKMHVWSSLGQLETWKTAAKAAANLHKQNKQQRKQQSSTKVGPKSLFEFSPGFLTPVNFIRIGL